MANALLIVMVLGGILCVSVMYYLALIQQQNTLSVRSQSWNIAIAISEAGIEEGLQALNSTGTPTSADGWSFDGTSYWRTNSLGDNWYTVSINKGLREIISRAYVTLPALAANTPSTFFAVAAVSANSVAANPTIISRAVRVRYAQNGLFLAAMVAKHQIDLKGNGILTDSFDSGDIWKSNFGRYDASVYAGDNGDIASNDGVVSTISVGNANIYGKAHTGPEGTVAIGSQGAVGTHAWQAAGNKGFQNGYVLQDANFTFPDPTLPYSTGLPLGGPETVVTATYNYTRASTNSTTYPNPPPWSGVITNIRHGFASWPPSPPPPGLVTNTVPDWSNKPPAEGTYVPPFMLIGKRYYFNRITGYTWPIYSYTYNLYTTNVIYTTNYYDHVIDSGDYYTTANLSGSTLVRGNARLVLPNGLTMSGNDKITVALNGSIKVFCDGAACTVSGNGVINQSGYAANFILECTPNVKTFTFNGNGEFSGVLVAPEADMAMNGGGSGDDDFIGCLMMNSIRMNGHFSFHYDEALGRMNNNPRLLITSWDEIP